MESRLCFQCDAPVEVEAKFCKNCGAAMSATSAATEQTLATYQDTPVSSPPAPNPLVPALQQPLAPAAYQPPIQQNVYPQQMPQNTYPQVPQNLPYGQAPIQQVNVVMSNTASPVVLVKSKSVGVSLLLTFLFGPLGMFYSTVSGAVIMLIVSVVLAAFTLGVSIFITWPICMIWGAMAASSYNNTIVTRT